MSKQMPAVDTALFMQADSLSQFHMDTQELRLALVKAQYALRETRNRGQGTGLLLLINGMELSGKGAAVTQLRQWVDPRLLNVEATIGQAPSRFEPIWQAHVEKLPRHGNITAYFGNWYADLITGVWQRIQNATPSAPNDWEAYLQQQLQLLARFEADLKNNHTQILKCWFHIDAATLTQRLTDCQDDPVWLYHLQWHDKQQVDLFNQIAKIILSQQSDWVIINGSNLSHNELRDSQPSDSHDTHAQHTPDKKIKATYADSAEYTGVCNDKSARDSKAATLQFCHAVLHSVQKALSSSQQSDSSTDLGVLDLATKRHATFSWADVPDKLIDIHDDDMDKSDYRKALATKQAQLVQLLRARRQSGLNAEANQRGYPGCKSYTGYKDTDKGAHKKDDDNRHHVIFAFEGMDAAGKGGAIKRLVSPLDPREYQIYNTSAPTAIELQHPYLWRFWTRLPQFDPCLSHERLSRIAIFDRTWYGRVLVERVEGFASEEAWQRAYDEINHMEQDLANQGSLILKYWLAIDRDEQLERFEDRKETAHKRFKLTDDDWRNRDKWQEYVQAAADMLARTNTKHAPWHVVATNDKRTARLAVLDHAIKQLQKHIRK